MNKPSRAQELFIRRLKIRRITVYAARILILAGFLFLWELRLPVVFLWRAWRHGNFTGAEHVGLD